MFSRFFNKKGSNSSSQKDPASAESNNPLPGLSAEKLKAVIISINQAEPFFLRAGYMLEQLDVEFGNTPKLTPHFKRLESVSEDEFEKILAQLEDQPLNKFMLISLHKSARMQSLFVDSELYFYGIEIDISSSPSVRTIFKRKESIAEVVAMKPKT